MLIVRWLKNLITLNIKINWFEKSQFFGKFAYHDNSQFSGPTRIDRQVNEIV